ncbi:MAG: SDR family oxidoreductase [Balneolia bacterium]|nr:SDR family oxidoreductase [Balneolia bacterium]
MSTDNAVLVTGASRGIGRETAIALLKKNIRVIALARTADKLQELKNKFPKLVYTLAVDLTSDQSYRDLADLLTKEKLRLKALIHNAGALINKPFLETTDEDWSYLIQANTMSSIKLIRTCHPFLGKESHIVQIGSMGGFQGSSKFPGLTAYSVSKGTLSILTECLAGEFIKDDIRINCLCLGAVQTEMLEAAFPGLKVPVQSEQMGAYIAGFALEAQKFFNGKVLPVSLADPS